MRKHKIVNAKYQEQSKWYNSGKRPLDEMKNELDGLYLRLGGFNKETIKRYAIQDNISLYTPN